MTGMDVGRVRRAAIWLLVAAFPVLGADVASAAAKAPALKLPEDPFLRLSLGRDTSSREHILAFARGVRRLSVKKIRFRIGLPRLPLCGQLAPAEVHQHG